MASVKTQRKNGITGACLGLWKDARDPNEGSHMWSLQSRGSFYSKENSGRLETLRIFRFSVGDVSVVFHLRR